MKFNKDYLHFLVIVITGLIILCSILLVKHIIVYNYFTFASGYFGFIIEFGFYLALSLGVILTGFIAAYIFSTECIFQKNRLIISAGAGLLAALLPSFFLYNLPFFVLSAAFGGMGAYLFSLIDQSPQNANQESEKKSGKMIGVRTTIILFIVSILLCMFIPLGICHAAGADRVDYFSYWGWGHSFDITASRPDASSINLIITGNYSYYYPAGSRNVIDMIRLPMQITIDGKDFSNQSVIRQQGLNDTMTPPEGISVYGNGTSILITGPDIIKNGSVGRHIVVTCISEHGRVRVIVDEVI